MTITRGKEDGPGRMHSGPSYLQWSVDAKSGGSTLADYLAAQLLLDDEDTRDLIDFGSVQIEGRQERDPKRRVASGEEIRVYQPRGGTRRFYEIDPKRILFLDATLLAYDKEPGVPSQQTPADAYNNLFAAILRNRKKEGGRDPYVALHHRLDRETSGVMLFALDRSANRRLGDAFQSHEVKKEYLAWVEGRPAAEEWIAREDIGRKDGRYRTCPQGRGKSAETMFRTIHRDEDRSLVLAVPRTGRTHQIRLHLAAGGHPVVGDRLYGGKPAARLYLHAFRLRLPHPVNRSELVLTAPVPPDWPPPHPEL